MRTKLCVLGAVLGTASILPGALLPQVETLQSTKQEPPRGLSSQRNAQPPRSPGAEPPASQEAPAGPASRVPTHPCELITVMQVPCDAATTTCEYTYWDCSRAVKPLSA